MDFKRNIVFTSLIKIDGRLSEFNFRKRGDSYYDIDTHDNRGNRLYLKMEKQSDGWIFVDIAVPAWLMKCETQINAAIEKEEQNKLNE